jgi:hypothetical protein
MVVAMVFGSVGGGGEMATATTPPVEATPDIAAYVPVGFYGATASAVIRMVPEWTRGPAAAAAAAADVPTL